MRISREKLNKISHVVADVLATRPDVHFSDERNAIRLEIRKMLDDLFAAEARMDAEVRKKIESQKRTILEGSDEWDILYRKYYREELKKLGVG
jgi:hypothetical protein